MSGSGLAPFLRLRVRIGQAEAADVVRRIEPIGESRHLGWPNLFLPPNAEQLGQSQARALSCSVVTPEGLGLLDDLFAHVHDPNIRMSKRRRHVRTRFAVMERRYLIARKSDDMTSRLGMGTVVDVNSPLSAVGRVHIGNSELPDDHGRCRTHELYQLTCSQYEELREACGGCCQVCGFPARKMPQKRLYIDHERGRGDWAVRGLLCIRCNTILGIDKEVPRDERFAAFLSDSWYARMLIDLGLSPDYPRQPPIGSVLTFLARRLPPRVRNERGWEIDQKPWLGAKSWWDLQYAWGPHRLKVELPPATAA